jgi:SAM-dependent methyltransferase
MTKVVDEIVTEADVLVSVQKTRELLKKYMATSSKRPTFVLDGPLKPVPQCLVDGCELLEDRSEFLRRLPKGGVIGEVGTLYGDFAAEIIATCAPARLEIIDIAFNNLKPNNKTLMEEFGCIFHQGMSWDCLARLPDHHFDMLYIDAGHSFDACSKDLKEAGRVVKPGGLIACNDYTLIDPYHLVPYGVVQAVNAFAIERQAPFVYFTMQISGYYDVVLRNR